MISPLLYAKLNLFTTKAFSPFLARITKGLLQACAEFDPTASQDQSSKAELDCCEHT